MLQAELTEIKKHLTPEWLVKYVRADHNPDAPHNRVVLGDKFQRVVQPAPSVVIRDIEATRGKLSIFQRKLLNSLGKLPETLA